MGQKNRFVALILSSPPAEWRKRCAFFALRWHFRQQTCLLERKNTTCSGSVFLRIEKSGKILAAIKIVIIFASKFMQQDVGMENVEYSVKDKIE